MNKEYNNKTSFEAIEFNFLKEQETRNNSFSTYNPLLSRIGIIHELIRKKNEIYKLYNQIRETTTKPATGSLKNYWYSGKVLAFERDDRGSIPDKFIYFM